MNKSQRWLITATCCAIALSFTAAGVDQIISPSDSTSSGYSGYYANNYTVPFPSYPVAEYSPTLTSGAAFQCIASNGMYTEVVQPLNNATQEHIHTFTSNQECENQAALDQWVSS